MIKMVEGKRSDTYTAILAYRIQEARCTCTIKVPLDEAGAMLFVRQVAVPAQMHRKVLAVCIFPDKDGLYKVSWEMEPDTSVTVNLECDGLSVACVQLVFRPGDERIQSKSYCKVIREWNMVLQQ